MEAKKLEASAKAAEAKSAADAKKQADADAAAQKKKDAAAAASATVRKSNFRSPTPSTRHCPVTATVSAIILGIP